MKQKLFTSALAAYFITDKIYYWLTTAPERVINIIYFTIIITAVWLWTEKDPHGWQSAGE